MNPGPITLMHQMPMRTLLAIMLFAHALLCDAQSAQQVFKEAEAHYKQASYDKAISRCVATLRVKDNHRKAQEYLQLSWDAFLKRAMNDIRTAEVSSSGLNGSARVAQLQLIADRYKRLIDARNECASIPHAVNKATGKPFDFGPNDFYAEWQAAKDAIGEASNAAADYHYDRGLEFEQKGGMENARLAAKEFRQANLNSPGFKDARARYESNRAKATKRLAIIPFENNSGQAQYGAVQNMLTDWVVAALMKDGDAMEFTSIVTRDELQVILNEHRLNMSSLLDENTVVQSGGLLGVHQLVTGRINQIACEPMGVISRTYRREGQCVTGYRTAYNKEGKPYQQPVWNQVSAQVTEKKKEVKFRISGSFRMLDVQSGQLLKGDSFTEESPWNCTWGTFSGNECVLDRNDKTLVNAREQNPPTCSELTNQSGQRLASYLAKQIAYSLR